MTLDRIMSILKKPGQGEEALWQDLARLNIGPGKTFSLDALPDEQANALKAGVKDGFAGIEVFIAEYSNDPLVSGKISVHGSFLTKVPKRTTIWTSPICHAPWPPIWGCTVIQPQKRSIPPF